MCISLCPQFQGLWVGTQKGDYCLTWKSWVTLVGLGAHQTVLHGGCPVSLPSTLAQGSSPCPAGLAAVTLLKRPYMWSLSCFNN